MGHKLDKARDLGRPGNGARRDIKGQTVPFTTLLSVPRSTHPLCVLSALLLWPGIVSFALEADPAKFGTALSVENDRL